MKKLGSKTINSYSFDSFEEMLKWLQADTVNRYAVHKTMHGHEEIVATSSNSWSNDGFMIHYVDSDEWSMLDWFGEDGNLDEEAIGEGCDGYKLEFIVGYEEVRN